MQDNQEPRPDLDELIAQQDNSLENLTAIDYEFLGYQDAVRGDIRPEMKYNEAHKKGWTKARHPDLIDRHIKSRMNDYYETLKSNLGIIKSLEAEVEKQIEEGRNPNMIKQLESLGFEVGFNVKKTDPQLWKESAYCNI